MSVPASLRAMLEVGEGSAPAIGAPGREVLNRAGLRRQVDALCGALRTVGVGNADRVAMLLPNGPEMAVAFLGVAACAVAAPLNPAYRAEEFDFYLSDLEARVLLIEEGLESPARAVAQRHGIPIVDVRCLADQPAGSLRLLRAGKPVAPATPDFGTADDGALVLHTSGTTSRPKIVPPAQKTLLPSARNTPACLALTPADRCLVIMPLFHIHGLIGALT